MRSGGNPAADRITSLPCSILEKILGCLPLHNAIRTSVLSREWRYKWVVRSELVFDSNVDRGNIYQVMLIHQGPLRKFSLYVGDTKLLADIDHWILFLSMKNVHEFSLKFLRCQNDFRLPSHLFKFQDLRHLDLLGCKFHPPPNFKSFSRLVTLYFQLVTFEPIPFQTLLSSSPLLERVFLMGCTRFDSFIVDAPRLKFFQFRGQAKSICFKQTPLLEEVIVSQYFYNLQSFTLGLPESHVTLHNLKLLNIRYSDFDKVVHLISRCPNLERLHIADLVMRVGDHLLFQRILHSTVKQLKRVDLKLDQVNETVMEFLKFVLSCATRLEKICVLTFRGIGHQGVIMLEELKQFARLSHNVEFTYGLY